MHFQGQQSITYIYDKMKGSNILFIAMGALTNIQLNVLYMPPSDIEVIVQLTNIIVIPNWESDLIFTKTLYLFISWTLSDLFYTKFDLLIDRNHVVSLIMSFR